MKRVIILASTIVLLGLVGCSDPRNEQINMAMSLFRDAAGQMQAIQETLDKAVTSAKEQNRKLTEKDFDEATKSAAKLRETGKKLISVRSDIEFLQEGASPEKKKETEERYREKYSNQLSALIKDLSDTQTKIDATLAQAEKLAPKTAIDQLRKSLRDSQEELISLTKPR